MWPSVFLLRRNILIPNRVLIRMRMFIFGSGWIVSIILGIMIIRLTFFHEKFRDISSTECPQTVIESKEPERTLAQKDLDENPKIMQVYVRPHPPSFLQGQWVRFRSYEKIKKGQGLKVKFLKVDNTS